MIFKIFDYQNIPVILTKPTWEKKLLHPVFGHPEIKPFTRLIKKTIKDPEYVYLSFRDPRSKLFFRRVTHGQFAGFFLAVVVKYVVVQDIVVGYVSTAMINRKLPTTSKLIWERKIST